MILIVAEHREGRFLPVTRDLIGLGTRMAGELEMPVTGLVMGHEVGELASTLSSWQLDRVLVADDERLFGESGDAQAAVLSAVIGQEHPGFVMGGHTSMGLEFLPRVAVRTRGALVAGCVDFEKRGETLLFTRGVFNSKLHMRVSVGSAPEGPCFITVAAGSASDQEPETGPGVAPEAVSDATLAAALSEVGSRTRLIGIEEAEAGDVSLDDADTIVAVGRGIGKADNLPVVQELADALGAPLGASRPVVDAGWLPRDRQIGSSGQTVAPRLYMAIGISGAVQHLVGMQTSQCIVAINKDAEAPVFKVAHYGITGDLFEIVPELTRLIRALKKA